MNKKVMIITIILTFLLMLLTPTLVRVTQAQTVESVESQENENCNICHKEKSTDDSITDCHNPILCAIFCFSLGLWENVKYLENPIIDAIIGGPCSSYGLQLF